MCLRFEDGYYLILVLLIFLFTACGGVHGDKNQFFLLREVSMSTKQTISILALSLLIALPVGIASAREIQVKNGNSRVTIDRNGDINIKNGLRIRSYRRRLRRNSASVPSRSVYRHIRNRGNCTTSRSTHKSGSGNNRSYVRTRTTTCQ